MLKNLFKHFFLVIILILLWPQNIYAADPPTLTSPSDNSTESKSPKLTWQYSGTCVESGSCFKVEVDNSPDFLSPEKSTYTNSFSYSPQNLAEGTYNWKVKAKDTLGTWSEWSQVFRFTISAAAASIIPSPTPNLPASSEPTSLTSPTSQKSPTSFLIKDIPSEINSDQDFETLISLTLPNNPNQTFYLKGAFKKEGSSNYFGQTEVSGKWVKNNEKYLKQLKITTDALGNWEGKIKVKPDQDDSGFDGSGSYIFKVARYNEAGSGPAWSNELNLKINAVAEQDSSTASKPQPQEKNTDQEPEEVDFTGSLVKAPTPVKNYEIKIASVAGEATMSNNISLEEPTKVLEEKKINWLLITLGIGILLSGVGFTYFKFKKEKSSAINTN